MGHLDEDQFLEQRFEDKGGPAKAYTSKCEDTTVYVKDTGRYLCECPKRKPLPEGANLEQEQKEKMQELHKLIEEAKQWKKEITLKT